MKLPLVLLGTAVLTALLLPSGTAAADDQLRIQIDTVAVGFERLDAGKP